MNCLCNLFNDNTVWVIIIALIILWSCSNGNSCSSCGGNYSGCGNNGGCGCGCG